VVKPRSKSFYFLVVLLAFLLVLSYFLYKDKGQIKDFIDQSGRWAFLVSVLLFGILGASPIPSEPFTVLVTGLFGPFHAMLITFFGNTISGLVEYFIGTRIGDVADFENRKASLPLKLGKLPANSPVFLLAGRMIPGFGPKTVSLVSGVYKVPLGRYIWTGLVTNLAGAAIVAYGTSGVFSLIG
jgi:uncharacterized membrane protein YdjX (TVP38/TMEM64 family)